jgi:predicted DNA-binding transcriptional regulator AlpA
VEREEIRLMGTAEIAERLGVTPARVAQLTDSVRREFPRPLARLKMGQVWLAQDVEAWIAEHRPNLAEDPES